MQQLHKEPWSQDQVQCLEVRTGCFCIESSSHEVSVEDLHDGGVKRGLCRKPVKKTTRTTCQKS